MCGEAVRRAGGESNRDYSKQSPLVELIMIRDKKCDYRFRVHNCTYFIDLNNDNYIYILAIIAALRFLISV